MLWLFIILFVLSAGFVVFEVVTTIKDVKRRKRIAKNLQERSEQDDEPRDEN